MRVLMLSWEYPPHIVGGMGKHVMDLVPALAAEGVEVHVITPLLRDGLGHEQTPAGVFVYRVEPPHMEDYGFVAFAQQTNMVMERAARDLMRRIGTFNMIHAHDWLAAPAGILIFQRVLSDIRADRLDAAAKQLDEAASDAGFDPVNRWQAEWNLVREMQVKGQTQPAYARVEKLLAGGSAGVPEELRIRLLWLRAKLSLDNGQPESALKQADDLLASLVQPGQFEA